MPKSHRAHVEWTPSRIIHWGGTVGEATAQVVKTILESKPHPEMGYRACLGILHLGKTYTNLRLEAACSRALQLNACSYQSLSSILKRSLDRQAQPDAEPERPGARHKNLRGARYYNKALPPTLF
jgi:transposase